MNPKPSDIFVQDRSFERSIVPDSYTLRSECMTASEQMFFLGAPLAHVAAHEERLIREHRLRGPHSRQFDRTL